MVRSISILGMPAKPYFFLMNARILKSSTRRSANSCLEAYQRLRQSSITPTRNPVGRTFWPMCQSPLDRVVPRLTVSAALMDSGRSITLPYRRALARLIGCMLARSASPMAMWAVRRRIR